MVIMGRKNKGSSKTMRKEIRLQKARQWVMTYNGTPKYMVKNYRKRFHVDVFLFSHSYHRPSYFCYNNILSYNSINIIQQGQHIHHHSIITLSTNKSFMAFSTLLFIILTFLKRCRFSLCH